MVRNSEQTYKKNCRSVKAKRFTKGNSDWISRVFGKRKFKYNDMNRKEIVLMEEYNEWKNTLNSVNSFQIQKPTF